MVLLDRGPDVVAKHPLSYPMNEDDSTQFFAFGNVHHAVKVVHLNGEFGTVGQSSLVVHQFVDVKVHLHVGIPAGHACGLRVLIADLEVFLEFAHALLPHFLGQKLRHIRNRVAVLLGFLFRVWGNEKFSLVDGALESIFILDHHGGAFDAHDGGAAHVVQKLHPLSWLQGPHHFF